MTWFSASLRSASIIEHYGMESLSDSVYLISAANREEAWAKALYFGAGIETNYRNADGELIKFVFVGVLTIDELGHQLVEGQEVCCQSNDFVRPIPSFFQHGVLSGTGCSRNLRYRFKAATLTPRARALSTIQGSGVIDIGSLAYGAKSADGESIQMR